MRTGSYLGFSGTEDDHKNVFFELKKLALLPSSTLSWNAALKKEKCLKEKTLWLPQMWNRVSAPTPNSRVLQRGKAWMKAGPEPGLWMFIPHPRALGQSRKAVGTSVPSSGPRIRAGGPPAYLLAKQPRDQPFQMLLLLLPQSQPGVFNVLQI